MMEFQLDQEWRLRPIKGDTGKTYIGMRDEDKVFIKRNTTGQNERGMAIL